MLRWRSPKINALKELAAFNENYKHVCHHQWVSYMGEEWCENCEVWRDGTPTALNKGNK